MSASYWRLESWTLGESRKGQSEGVMNYPLARTGRLIAQMRCQAWFNLGASAGRVIGQGRHRWPPPLRPGPRPRPRPRTASDQGALTCLRPRRADLSRPSLPALWAVLSSTVVHNERCVKMGSQVVHVIYGSHNNCPCNIISGFPGLMPTLPGSCGVFVEAIVLL